MFLEFVWLKKERKKHTLKIKFALKCQTPVKKCNSNYQIKH